MPIYLAHAVTAFGDSPDSPRRIWLEGTSPGNLTTSPIGGSKPPLMNKHTRQCRPFTACSINPLGLSFGYQACISELSSPKPADKANPDIRTTDRHGYGETIDSRSDRIRSWRWFIRFRWNIATSISTIDKEISRIARSLSDALSRPYRLLFLEFVGPDRPKKPLRGCLNPGVRIPPCLFEYRSRHILTVDGYQLFQGTDPKLRILIP